MCVLLTFTARDGASISLWGHTLAHNTLRSNEMREQTVGPRHQMQAPVNTNDDAAAPARRNDSGVVMMH